MRAEVQRMASEIRNPVYRSGFEHCMNYSLRQLPSSIPTREFDCSPIDKPNEMPGGMRKSEMSPFRHSKRRELLSSYQTIHENPFGKVVFWSTTFLKRANDDAAEAIWADEQLYEHNVTFRIEPSWWLLKMGFNHGLRVAVSQATNWSLNITLNPFRLVPDDALIFDLCDTGDIDGVRRLLIQGEASARDTDSFGRTPLFVSIRRLEKTSAHIYLQIAARGCHADLSRLLIEAGADQGACPWSVTYNYG